MSKTQFKPMLSATIDPMKDADVFSKLTFPLLGSPKLDGIRCLPRGGRCVSRKLLDLPREHVHQMFGHLEHLDGEIIVGNASDPDVYNRTQSYVMSKDERPLEDISFYIFDWAAEDVARTSYERRFDFLYQFADRPGVKLVEQTWLRSLDELLAFEEEQIALGYEGIMVRSPDGAYKWGRSTFKEHGLMKLKRFQDDEAEVVGFVEAEHNYNDGYADELGHTKRSSCKEGKVGANTLGKFIVIFPHPVFGNLTLEIPPGVLKHSERQHIWDNQSAFLGKTLKFRHFPHGAKDKPRLPRFVGWRTAEDM